MTQQLADEPTFISGLRVETTFQQKAMEPNRPRARAHILLNHVASSLPPAQAKELGPLAGFKILDMSTVISGPWGASILADQGMP
jgi:hypothetical protein